MVAINTSTSVSLLYVERPNLNFARCVDNLEKALRDTAHVHFQMSWDNDDYVQFDIDGSRVVLGFDTLTPSAPVSRAKPAEPHYAAALVMAVGPGLRRGEATLIARNAQALCSTVIDSIDHWHPADLTLWKQIDGVFTADHFDELVDIAINLPPEKGSIFIEEAEVRTAAQNGSKFGAVPEKRLMDRAAAEIRPRQVYPSLVKEPPPRPAPLLPQHPPMQALNIRVTAANDAPHLPHPMQEELARIRAALYPPEPKAAVTEKEPLARRLTLYTFNTTLLIVSLPVGAALLTYNVLGHEDSRVTARLMAVTGVIVGLLHTFAPGLMLHGT